MFNFGIYILDAINLEFFWEKNYFLTSLKFRKFNILKYFGCLHNNRLVFLYFVSNFLVFNEPLRNAPLLGALVQKCVPVAYL